ncbi:MAG TPA: dethiobiotin synthase [Gemmatimonadaceae bacterium]|jgi:dethiobiotin synthetase
MIRIGVTGTDTGVGKTVVSCALASGLRRRGLRVAAMKPIETGVAAEDPSRDGARLARAAGGPLPLSMLSPLVYPDPVAPLVAARRIGTTVDTALLDHAVKAVSNGADALVVEGAGGLLVPITDRIAFDTLFSRWKLDAVVVAANRLGVINHTRLTLAALRAADITISLVVLNTVSAETDTSSAENAKIIAELENVSVVELPWLPDAGDLERASELLLEPVIHELERSGRPIAGR